MSIDVKQIEAELKSGNTAKAGEMIRELLNEDLSTDEKGATILALVTTYMNMVNEVNKEHLDDLNEAIQNIRDLNEIDEDVKDVDKINQIRNSLNTKQ